MNKKNEHSKIRSRTYVRTYSGIFRKSIVNIFNLLKGYDLVYLWGSIDGKIIAKYGPCLYSYRFVFIAGVMMFT
jgi:hypothetical protein